MMPTYALEDSAAPHTQRKPKILTRKINKRHPVSNH